MAGSQAPGKACPHHLDPPLAKADGEASVSARLRLSLSGLSALVPIPRHLYPAPPRTLQPQGLGEALCLASGPERMQLSCAPGSRVPIPHPIDGVGCSWWGGGETDPRDSDYGRKAPEVECSQQLLDCSRGNLSLGVENAPQGGRPGTQRGLGVWCQREGRSRNSFCSLQRLPWPAMWRLALARWRGLGYSTMV